jgi:hypothetical protein
MPAIDPPMITGSRQRRRLLSRRAALLAAALLAAWSAATAATPPRASASCMPPDPRGQLADADAAFIGTLIGMGAPVVIPDPATGNRFTMAPFAFSVERWVKADLGGPVVEIFGPFRTSVDFGFQPGTRIGVLVHLQDGRPTSSGCAVFDPEVLLAAAAPVPSPDGSGPPALIVGGDFGAGRLVLLDTHGRALAYSDGEGMTSSISMCPGGRRFVETWWSLQEHAEGDVAVREVATLDLVREIDSRALYPESEDRVSSTACLDEDGTDIVGLLGGVGLVALDGERRIIGPMASGWTMFVPGGLLYRPEMKGAQAGLHWMDLTDGSTDVIHDLSTDPDHIGDFHSVVVSPDGTRVAVNDWLDGRPTHDLTIHRLPDGAVLAHASYPSHDGSTAATWIDDETLAVVSYGSGEAGQALDGVVRIVRASDAAETARWQGWRMDARSVGGILVGVDDGHLLVAPVTGGEVVDVHTFDGLMVGPIVPLPGLDGEVLVAAGQRRAAEATPSPTAVAPGVPGTRPGELGTLTLTVVVMGTGTIVLMAAVLGIRARRRR